MSDKRLTDEQISQACLLWMHGIDDKQIATALGISQRTFIRRMKEFGEQDIVLNIFGQETSVTTSLRKLKQSFKQMFEASYLQRLHKITDSAQQGDDFKTASSNLKWLMEKIMPEKYGKTVPQHDLPPINIVLPKGLEGKEF